MGYRNYIYVVDKETADRFRKKNFRELETSPKSNRIDIFEVLTDLHAVHAYELGKDVDIPMKDGLIRFFNDDKVHEALNGEYEFMILDPRYLQTMATYYKNKVIDLNKKLLAEYENNKTIGGEKLYKDLKYRTSMMTNLDEFNDNAYCLTDTWLWEFDLLNFLYLLKKVDFNKKYLLWLGW